MDKQLFAIFSLLADGREVTQPGFFFFCRQQNERLHIPRTDVCDHRSGESKWKWAGGWRDLTRRAEAWSSGKARLIGFGEKRRGLRRKESPSAGWTACFHVSGSSEAANKRLMNTIVGSRKSSQTEFDICFMSDGVAVNVSHKCRSGCVPIRFVSDVISWMEALRCRRSINGACACMHVWICACVWNVCGIVNN